jgi:hypothetical protein
VTVPNNTPSDPAYLAGRLLIGRLVAADFAVVLEHPVRDYYRWAARLYAALSGLVEALDADRSRPGPADLALIAVPDLPVLLGALRDGATWRRAAGDDAGAARYRELSAALGDR